MVEPNDFEVDTPSRSISSNKNTITIQSKGSSKICRKCHNQTIKWKHSWNIIPYQTLNHQKNPSNVGKVGEVVINTCLKSSINSRIQKFGKGPLIIFPLDGQIWGEVVVGTTNGDNLGGSSYLYPFRTIGFTSTWFVWHIFRY